MKKNLLSGILVAGLFSLGVNAQNNTFPTTGNVGIGIVPTQKLDVNGNLKVKGEILLSGTTTSIGGINGTLTSGANLNSNALNIKLNGTSRFNQTKVALANVIDLNATNVKTRDMLYINYLNNFDGVVLDGDYVGTSASKFSIGVNNPVERLEVYGNIRSHFSIIADRAIIGATTFPPTASCNKLYVAGTIGAQEVRVSMTNWCDYVFEKDYNLKSLKEVDAYIQANKHLPEVPSEKEVVENGVAMGEMMKIHMKKIEELTLYMIELQKQNEKLAAEVAGLKK